MSTKTFEVKRKSAQSYYIESNNELTPLGPFFSVGRHPSNDLAFLEDPFTSQKHCRIEKKGSQYILKDLKSRNGTFLNGERILEAPLKPYDEIQVGQSVFLYRESLEVKTDIPESFYNSKNQSWQNELKRIPAIGSSDIPVLVMGPSGAGKEYLTKALHFNSSRAYGELVSLNCSAFSEQLIESELFGHLEGSFTGATKNRKGAFQQAKGGTLVLDEIGDLPLNLQPKLLRALENKEIRPVGSDKSIKTDVRVIASTHKNLLNKVETGEFREDLFYRLSALTIEVPSLLDRMEDFESLLFNFSKNYKIRFSPDAIKFLKRHEWPGNIRELKNTVMRASVLYKDSGVDLHAAQDLLSKFNRKKSTDNSAFSVQSNGSLVKEMEKQMIIKKLKENKGNQRKTAQDLGMAKSTLHDKIKRYLSTENPF
jgi:transcriptional regulator with PAS, ATPase and Fis domain